MQKNLVYVGVRIPPQTLEKLEDVSHSNNESRSRCIRRALRSYLRKPDTEVLLPLLDQLIITRPELARVGSNLNQLARSFNISGEIEHDKLATNHQMLRNELTELNKTLREIIHELADHIR